MKDIVIIEDSEIKPDEKFFDELKDKCVVSVVTSDRAHQFRFDDTLSAEKIVSKLKLKIIINESIILKDLRNASNNN